MNPAGPPTTPALSAPPHWQAVDFISDLHLHGSDSATFDAWAHYMADTPADAVFILGDLFEVWVGDDVVDAQSGADFERRCAQVLHAAARRKSVYFMHGNRDFLVGQTFLQACQTTLLDDPTVLAFDQHRWLLSHGDALCLGDTDYQRFRREVRGKTWRSSFLAKPLRERQALARGLREQSESRKASAAIYADVDNNTARDWLMAAQADTLIHGHTHRPADHMIEAPPEPMAANGMPGSTSTTPLRRLVLSDWDAQARPARLQVLRLQTGLAPQRLNLAVTGQA